MEYIQEQEDREELNIQQDRKVRVRASRAYKEYEEEQNERIEI